MTDKIDKVIALLPIYEAGLIPMEKVLEIFGFTKEDLEK